MTVGSVRLFLPERSGGSLTYFMYIDFILASCDVEGNFLVVKAYTYTTLLSCMLLDAYVILTFGDCPCLNLIFRVN